MDYNVAVIGGGPAGMMAAIKASESGASVVLIEKNNSLGKKLLITAKGRCNITQTKLNNKDLADKFGREGRFLLHGFSIFGPNQTVELFESLGLKTKLERSGRIFPKTDKAEHVLRALKNQLNKNKVKILTGRTVKKIVQKKKKISSLLLNGKESITADRYILATGGKSYPILGSTGDGFRWAKDLGHTIIEPRPALTPIKTKEDWPKNLQGLTLKNISLAIFEDDKKMEIREGELLFAHFGITGPIVLDMSKRIGELLEKKKNIKLILDLKPGLDFKKLDNRLQRDFIKYNKKLFKNSLNDLLPERMIHTIVDLSGIDANKPVNEITRTERHKLIKALKEIELTPIELLGFDKAIITSGGISLKEVNAKTMQSKVIENLYLAGEILNLDGPTGGYNLQVCWSTGYLAGKAQ